jgi:PAS domain S-box-containing protein
MAATRLRQGRLICAAVDPSRSSLAWCCSASGTQAEPDPSWLSFTGQTADEAKGMGWLNAAHPEDRSSVRDLWTRAAAVGEPFRAEFRVRRVDAAFRVMRTAAVPRRAADGSVGEWIWIATDITELSESAEELRRTQAKLRAVLSSLADGVVFLNPQGIVEETNEAVERLHGHTLDELVDSRLDPRHRIVRADGSLLPEEEQPAMVALRTGAAVRDVELGVPDASGEIRWRLVNAQPVHDGDRLLGVVASFFDITARKRAEAALRASEARYRSLFKNMTDGFAIGEPICGEDGSPRDFRLLETNDAFERHTGLARADVEGHPIREVLPHIEGKWVDVFCAVAQTGEPVRLESYNVDLGKHFDVYCYRPAPDRFAIVFSDITERRFSEQAGERDHELLARLFERLPVMIAMFHPELGNFRFNEEFKRTLGWTEEDAAAGDLMRLAYPDPDVRAEALHHMALARSTWREFPVTAKDGSTVPSSWANLKLRDDTQVGIGIDLQERKRTEHALRQSEATLRAVVDHLPIGLILAELPTGVLHWNRNALEIHGYSAAEDEHRLLQALVSVHELRTLEGSPIPVERWPLPRLLAGEEFRDCRILVRHVRKGWERTFSYSAVVVPGTDPRIGVLAIQDITAARRAERAAQESQQLLRSTMDHFPTVIAFKDRQGRFVDVNPAVAAALQLPRDQIVGRTMYDFVPKDAADVLTAHEREVMESRTARQVEEVTPLPGGTLYHLDTNFPLIGTDGSVYGTGHISLDITELKRIEMALRAANERLLDADERKTEFLATLAHELRNPLAPLRNAVEILGRSTDATIVGEARAMMVRQLAQMVRLVDDLLDVSRITTGKLQLERQRLDVHRVIEQAIETARPGIDARRHRLVVEPADRDLRVNGDAVRLAQILTNILNNAAKYSDPGATIVVRVRARGNDMVEIAVQDTGIGLEQRSLQRVFDLFAQIDDGTDRAHGGLGIGLALARRLAEMHGGTLTADSAGLGHGSTFTLALPLAEPLLPALTGDEQGNRLRRARCRVVVVDDNRDAADSLAIMLKLNGHEVSSVYDGQAAIHAIRAQRPQAAVVDIGMPGCDGYEVARALREDAWSESLVLIALTGWGQDEDKRRSEDAGFDHHFTKPVEPGVIESVLSELPGCEREG